MRLLFYCDLHLADSTPESRTGSYKEDMLTKLREIVQLANDYEVDYVLNGADTFDRKNAWRTSHRLVRETAEILKGLKRSPRVAPEQPFHIAVVGTHDVPTGRLDKLPQQPLGILEEMGLIHVLGEPYRGDNGQPQDVMLLDSNITLHGVPAKYDLDKDPSNYALTDDVPANHVVVTMAHGMIVPPGRTFFSDYTDADTIETNASLVLYGHPHTPDGIYMNKHGTIFVGPGSVSRRDKSPYNRSRQPKVVLIGIDEPGSSIENRFQFKELELRSARPAAEVFAQAIADIEDENTRDARALEFAQQLATADIANDAWGRDQLLNEIRGSGAPQEVRKRAEDILEQVSE